MKFSSSWKYSLKAKLNSCSKVLYDFLTPFQVSGLKKKSFSFFKNRNCLSCIFMNLYFAVNVIDHDRSTINLEINSFNNLSFIPYTSQQHRYKDENRIKEALCYLSLPMVSCQLSHASNCLFVFINAVQTNRYKRVRREKKCGGIKNRTYTSNLQ